MLFAGQDMHGQLLAERDRRGAGRATPVEAVAAGLDALAGTFIDERREFGRRLLAVIAAQPSCGSATRSSTSA